MSEILFQQLETVRSWTIEVAQSIPEEIVHTVPEGFNNNLLWQVGHVLASTEYFLFDLPEKEIHLPNDHYELFGSGTSPGEWNGDVPKIAQLITDLENQSERMKQISNEQLRQPLPAPKHGFQTAGDCAGFSVMHEALHVGKIEEMQRLLTS